MPDVTSFSELVYAPDDSPDGFKFMVVLTVADGGELRLTMSPTIAAQIAARISEAIKTIDKEKGSQTAAAPPTPERIMRFNAAPSPMEPDEIIIVLDGERSNRLLGRMKLTGARSLAALLTAAAERGGPKPTN